MRRWIELAIVAGATVVAFVWTLSSAVALLPAVYYWMTRQADRDKRRTAA